MLQEVQKLSIKLLSVQAATPTPDSHSKTTANLTCTHSHPVHFRTTGDVAGHTACLNRLREAMKITGKIVAVLLDTKGPEIR